MMKYYKSICIKDLREGDKDMSFILGVLAGIGLGFVLHELGIWIYYWFK